MGCNAWNHSSNCTCGWGGDTGGGYGDYCSRPIVQSPPPRISVPSGLDWRGNAVGYETYINPNAKCPVCGDDVFFYQSPYGGKVFFDELGPPWPKHPCTDQSSFSTDNYTIAPASENKKPFDWTRFFQPEEWKPFPIELIKNESGIRIFRKNEKNFKLAHLGHLCTELHKNLLGEKLIFPSSIPENTPIYWRKCPTDPCFIEISTIINDGQGIFREHIEKIPVWISTSEELKSHLGGQNPSGKTLNKIGWWLSFERRADDNKYTWYKTLGSDGKKARKLFKEAGEKGSWEGFNNLAVMLRDGIGGKIDLAEAFFYFEKAAESLGAVPLRHLAKFYREGLACIVDAEHAEFLEELAQLNDEETSGKHHPRYKLQFLQKPKPSGF